MVVNLNSLTELQKRYFFLEFTKQLIRNSGEDIFELKNIIEEGKYTKKPLEREVILSTPVEKIKKIIPRLSRKPKEAENELRKIVKKGDQEISRSLTKPPKRKIINPVLRIPEPKLPPKFQYLKPIPTDKEIELDKLNPLVKDPMVKDIECNGPNQNIIVRGAMGTKKTNIILGRDDIDDIIERFSKATKIPVYEGVFKVVIGKLIFSAVISNVIGSRFIIKKMNYNPYFTG